MVEYARIITKSSEGPPTIPPSASHDNGDWSANDIYENELYVDSLTGYIYTRKADTIVLVSTTGVDFEVIHDTTLTGNGTLADPLGVNISPFADNAIESTADGLFVQEGVPYVGATEDVDLGEHQLKAGQVEFDQTPTGTTGVAKLRWNENDGTLDLGLKGGNVTLQIGQEQVKRVVNKTGANLLESDYRVVRTRLVSEGGAAGQRLAVVLAQADSDTNSATTIGIVTENIANNEEGFITVSGEVRNINTTGALQGETWVDGDILYLSPSTPGHLTNIKPVAPRHMVTIGQVAYAHAVNGKIDVAVQNGYELEELHDVTTENYTDPQDEDSFLFLEEITNLWKRLSYSSLKNKLLETFQSKLTLTTTGTSGAATLIGSTLNIPQYSGGGGVTADSLFQFYTRDGLFFFDEMFYNQGASFAFSDHLIVSSGSFAGLFQASSFFGLPPITNQRGVTLFRTGTTATGSVLYAFGATSSVPNMTAFYLANGVINYETYVLFPILSNSTERFWFDFGITSASSTAGTNPVSYVGIVYNEGTSFNLDNNTGGNPNFTFNTAEASTRTRTIGTSPVTANTWYRLRIEVNPATPVVNFYVNDVLVATHTTNIPTSSILITPIMRMVKTIGTTNREVACDYIALKQTFTTPR